MKRRLGIFLLITIVPAVLAGCTDAVSKGRVAPPVVMMPRPKANMEAKHFSGCDELHKWNEAKSAAYNVEKKKYERWLASSGSDGRIPLMVSGSSSTANTSATNNQDVGVDEPDIVKTDGITIYLARARSVEIVDAKSLALKQTLDFPALRDLKLFLDSGRLVVLGRNGYVLGTDFQPTHEMHVFKTGGKVELEFNHAFDGEMVDARLSHGQILLVSQTHDPIAVPLPIQNGRIHGVLCSAIRRPILDDLNMTMTTLQRIPVAHADQIFASARFGGASQVYATENHVYLLDPGYAWFDWDPVSIFTPENQSQTVAEFDWRAEDGPAYLGAALVEGFVRNVWSFHETADGQVLHIATTSYDKNYVQSNHLWAVESGTSPFELEVSGSSEAFGEHEDIRSARFIGDRAYIVTFEKTDPLFTFDLSDPRQPRLMNRLEVPGFSAYLHPVGAQQLLGVGYDAYDMGRFSWLEGVQLSLFDLSKPNCFANFARQTFGGRFSHTDVADDHHAFYYDTAARVAAIPVYLLKNATMGNPQDIKFEIDFSGALVVDLNSGLDPVARISHWDLVPANCQQAQAGGAWWTAQRSSVDIRRVFRAGGRFFSASPFGLREHDPAQDYSATRTLSFSQAQTQCDQILNNF